VTTKTSKKDRKKKEKVNQRQYLQAGAWFVFPLNRTKKKKIILMMTKGICN
jgi:hypothetical protein